jgi:hypothetical protein
MCLYALPAPTSGEHNIVVSRSGGGYVNVQAASYDGVDQSIPTQFVTNTGAGLTISLPFTVQYSGSWVVGVMGNNSTRMTFGSTGTVRQQINLGRVLFDAVGTPAQTQTFTANLYEGAVDPAWGGIAVELKSAQ